MADTIISFPESYQYYLNPQHHNAFSQITGKQNLPPSFSWADIRAYHHARFSLELIKYEYYQFVCELWEKTWGHSINQDNSFISSPAGAYAESEAPLFPEEVWLDRLVRLYSRRNTTYWFGITTHTAQRCIILSWYAETQDGEPLSSNKRLPSDIWEKNADDDYWRVTRKDFYAFDINDKIINLSALRSSANTTITLCKRSF